MNHALPAIQHAYAQCAYTPQHNQWTVLASVFLINNDDYKIISLATGTKCLPATRLSPRGESLHDSHAEVLARRAALRWLLQETQAPASPWLTQTPNGRYTVRPSVKFNLYVSTLPCGDASMRTLAALQDPTIASLKSTSLFPSLAPGAASRGRDDYARLGVLRTKPGRADSPPTPCLSCSDKIARWSVLGIQGALGAHLLEPLYLENIIIGEVPSDLREIALEDCTRAFSGRVGMIPDLPEGYALHPPTIHFTDIPFIHSRTVLQSSTSCIESLCLIADTPPEILINGLKRGVSPKHRYREKSRPSISRISMLNLVLNPTSPSNPTPNPMIESNSNSNSNPNSDPTYHRLKLQSHSYQAARSKLTGPNGPFSGWVLSGSHFQNFNARGEEVVPASTPDPLSLSASLSVASSLPTQSLSEVAF